MAWYVGVQKIHSGHERRRVFQTKKKVTKATFPFYLYVIGPFKTESAARGIAAQARHRPLLNAPIRKANAAESVYVVASPSGYPVLIGREEVREYRRRGGEIFGPYTLRRAQQRVEKMRERWQQRANPPRSRRHL